MLINTSSHIDGEQPFQITNILCAFAKGYFPRETALLSDENLFTRVEFQLQLAEQLNIESESDLYDLVSMCFLLGDDFYQNEAYPWAVDVFKNSSVTSGADRISLLNENARLHLRAITLLQPGSDCA